jgi:hypothetical protein
MFKYRHQNLLTTVQHFRNFAIEREKCPDDEFVGAFKTTCFHLKLNTRMTPYIKSTCQLCLLYLHDHVRDKEGNPIAAAAFVQVMGLDFLKATHLFLSSLLGKGVFDNEAYAAFSVFCRGDRFEDDFMLAVCEQLASRTYSLGLATLYMPTMRREFPHRALQGLYGEVIRQWRKTGDREDRQKLEEYSAVCVAKGFFSNIVYELVVAYITEEDALQKVWAVMNKMTRLDYAYRPETKQFWENREQLLARFITLYALSRTLAKSPDAEGYGLLITAYNELRGVMTAHSLRYVSLQIALYYQSIGDYEAAFKASLWQCGYLTELRGKFVGLARLCYKLYVDKMVEVWKRGGEYWSLAEQVTTEFEREMSRVLSVVHFHDEKFIDEVCIPMLKHYGEIVLDPMMRECLKDSFTPANRTMLPLIDLGLDMCRRAVFKVVEFRNWKFKDGEFTNKIVWFKNCVDVIEERLTVVRQACEARVIRLETEKWDAVEGDFWQVAETLTDFFEEEVLAEGELVPVMKGLYQTRVLDRLPAGERARALCLRVRNFSDDVAFLVDKTLTRL